LLNVASGGAVFTTIQKFFPTEQGGKHPLLSDRRNIVVIAVKRTAANTISLTALPSTCVMRSLENSIRGFNDGMIRRRLPRRGRL
jgi:hypothetical protein